MNPRTIRSSGRDILINPKSEKNHGEASFYYGRRLWNSLSDNLRAAENVDVFQSKLKTYFFVWLLIELVYLCISFMFPQLLCFIVCFVCGWGWGDYCFYASAPVTVVAGGIMFSGSLSVRLSIPFL